MWVFQGSGKYSKACHRNKKKQKTKEKKQNKNTKKNIKKFLYVTVKWTAYVHIHMLVFKKYQIGLSSSIGS